MVILMIGEFFIRIYFIYTIFIVWIWNYIMDSDYVYEMNFIYYYD